MIEYTNKEIRYLKNIRNNLSKKEIETFLKERGWEVWYSQDYWIHSKVVNDSDFKDKTNYGIGKKQAFIYEGLKAPPFSNKFSLLDIEKISK